MVVPGLITSCQVSEKPDKGPEILHVSVTPKAIMKAGKLPVRQVILLDSFEEILFFHVYFIFLRGKSHTQINANAV